MSLDLKEAYRRAFLIRHVEEELARRYHPDPNDTTTGPIRCPMHLSIGQEAVAVGVAMACPPDTHVWLTHRTHAPYLAFGGDLERMLAELYGRSTGCCGGWGGSMHLYDQDAGVMGGSAIVGSSVSLAVGSAFAARQRGEDRLIVAWGGDAVVETGQFWEAVNFALLHELRILFVIEDNGLSTATRIGARQDGTWLPDAWSMANSNAIAPAYLFGDDTEAIYEAVDELVSEPPPYAIHVDTTRWREHVGPGWDTWRDIRADNLPDNDPVAQLRARVDDPVGIEVDIRTRTIQAFQRAEAAPWPEKTW